MNGNALPSDTAALLDPHTLEAPLLVVAPHPDDESLACGGLLALAAATSVPLLVLTVTDGSASHPHSVEWPPHRLAALRSAESRAALAALGVPAASSLAWGLADGAVPRRKERGFGALVARCRQLLDDAHVRCLVVPWRRDPHRDHQGVSAAFRIANARSRLPARLLEYPLWVRARPASRALPRDGEVEELAVDIRAVLDRKRAAIDAHRSQRGLVVGDDPAGFSLEGELRALCEQSHERYWQARTGAQ